MDDKHVLADLVGRRVTGVWWSEEFLTFETDAGPLTYSVEGDCCSWSYFYDLIGFDKLLAGPVVSVNDVELLDSDRTIEKEYGDVTDVYGYQIVTQHPEWGEVTTALSFRNDNNGYYGGWMFREKEDGVREGQERLTADRVGT